MIDCTTCAQALPIAACPTGILLGVAVDDELELVVRFTDRATGRVTIAAIETEGLPNILVPTPFDLAPGLSVMAEVVSVVGGVLGAPVEFLPLSDNGFGDIGPTAYPITCVVFTPTKTFSIDGTVLAPGQRNILLDL